MNVYLINDDEGSVHYETADILEAIPSATVSVFDSPFDAWRANGSPKIIVCDLSAVGSILQPEHMYGPICSLLGRYPGAVLIINSAVSRRFAESVADDVKERCPDSVVRLVDWSECESRESFIAILKEAA